jgi:transcription initiation factor TFIIIB Brf1 subunit/transcription initiation factor TFIIB
VIRALSQAGKREIFKCFKLILGGLKISAKSYTTSDFMPRFCGSLGIAAKLLSEKEK